MSAKATRIRRHSRHEDDLSLYAMKNNLSALAMIFGANSTIVGGVGSDVGIAGGDGGGPWYMTGGEIGGRPRG